MSEAAVPVLESLIGYLETLDSDEFDALLDRRPDILARVFADPGDDGPVEGLVASLLASSDGVLPTVLAATTGAVQVLEILVACADRVPVGRRGTHGLRPVDEDHFSRRFERPALYADRSRAVALLGRTDPSTLAAFDAAVEQLVQHVLVWPEGGRLRLHPALGELFTCPLGLTAPAASVFAKASTSLLVKAVNILGGRSTAHHDRQALLDVLTRLLADGDAVRRVVAAAPAPARDLLQTAVAIADGRVPGGGRLVPVHTSGDAAGLRWLVEYGLAARDPADPYGIRQTVPREVVVALRGPGWRPPFDPTPPAVPLDALGGERLVAESSAAALSALLGASALFASIADQPTPTLRTGGVGARELTRLGKECSLDEDSVRLWLYVGEHAGILQDQDGWIVAHPDDDTWVEMPPEDKYAALLESWLDTRAWPTHPGFGTRRPAALAEAGGGYAETAPLVRRLVLTALATLPPDSGTDAAGVLALVRWHRPLLFRSNLLVRKDEPATVLPAADPGLDAATERLVTTIIGEAARLGLIAHGAPTPLYRSLLGATPDAGPDGRLGAALDIGDPTATTLFSEAVAGLLPPTADTVRIQADLTAVAAGLPSPALIALLDSCAVRESTGTAWVWRFSDASVRRHLDGGGTAESLLTGLRAASAGPLPQALEYLVTDAGRRHGRVVVQAAGSVILAADKPLAAELLGDKALTRLALRPIAPDAAPTVLISALHPEATLDVLRFAGYSPAGRHPDGTPLITRRTGPRAVIDDDHQDDDRDLFDGC